MDNDYYSQFYKVKEIFSKNMDKKQKCELITSIFQSIREAMQLDSDDSDKEEILLGLARLGEKAASLPIKRAKRQWIKEWRKNRCDRGSFAFLNKELLVHDEQSYRNFLRVSKSQFDYLLSLIANEIQRSDSTMRAAIPAAEKLALTLRFLSTGESYVSLDYQTRLSKSSISSIVPEVCSALYNKLKSSYLKFPNSNSEWEAIAKEFAVKWQFPNCIGALDGTRSIILLALVDANSKFIFVDVGCNGRSNDAGVFLQSKLRDVLQEEKEIPKAASIGNDRRLPYVVVGDDAFPLQMHLMKPYPYHTQCQEKQVFNQRLSRARHVVEHAFGILSNRFRVLLAPINLKVATVEKIVLTCCALHNYLIENGEMFTDERVNAETVNNNHSTDSDVFYNPRKGAAENVREQFLKYFNEEGKLDWLHNK
ncbi:uncharacterized protein LOC128869671 isoform X3 [Anastrepha ludens]|uniref:uncharacterized protein LOC128869671 isoform X3 n=1 Tax=Anastrepha ludens TaxID=28586 RepID=UPI0023B125E0|nr:uncharacterized protein LOC128869671 isoform X3 [Anastrepha ludens]